MDVAPDKTIVFVGVVKRNDFGKILTRLLKGGSDVVLRFNSMGKQVLSVARTGNTVDDMEVNRTSGRTAVIVDFGLAALGSP
jgi:hypothetical protein